MRAIQFLHIAVLFTCMNTLAGAEADLKVIAHPEFPLMEISALELRSVFLGVKTTVKDGAKVAPVLEKGGPLLAAFSREYLGKSDVALQTYYRSLIFAGKGSMPASFKTDSEVIDYVARTPGAIGFVHEAADCPGVKILRVK
jgi:hypothetical protein